MTSSQSAKARPASAAPPQRTQPVAVMIIGVLFFVFGFVTWLNGSLIPFLKIVCELSYLDAFLVTFAFYIAYTVMALPVSGILARTGYRNGIALGLAVMGLGALIHIPAAYMASFPMFLLGLFTLGTGLTVLQTAANPYIVLLGPAESAAKRISIMGVINKAAGVIAPIVFASLVLSRLGSFDIHSATPTPEMRHLLAGRLVVPYLAMALALFALVGFARLAPLPEVTPEPAEDEGQAKHRLLDQPRLILGVVALFAYVGMEVIAGDTIGVLGQQLGVKHFLSLTSYTMSFMVLGYCLGIILIPRFLTQRGALCASGIGGLLATCGVLFSSPHASGISQALWGWSGIATVPDPVFFVAFMGFAHALVWPTIWPLALKNLGDATPRASALLIMSVSGGALIPLLFGWLSTRLPSMQQAYAIGLVCYAIVLFYGWKGCLITRWRR